MCSTRRTSCPEIASNYFGKSVGSRTIQDLAGHPVGLSGRGSATWGSSARRRTGSPSPARICVLPSAWRGAATPETPLRQPLWAQALARLNDALACYEGAETGARAWRAAGPTAFERVCELRTWLWRCCGQPNRFLLPVRLPRLHFTLSLTPCRWPSDLAPRSAPEGGLDFYLATPDGGQPFDHFVAEMGSLVAPSLSSTACLIIAEQAGCAALRFLPEPNAFGRGTAGQMILINKTPGLLLPLHQPSVMGRRSRCWRRETGCTVSCREDNKQRLLKTFVEKFAAPCWWPVQQFLGGYI